MQQGNHQLYPSDARTGHTMAKVPMFVGENNWIQECAEMIFNILAASLVRLEILGTQGATEATLPLSNAADTDGFDRFKVFIGFPIHAAGFQRVSIPMPQYDTMFKPSQLFDFLCVGRCFCFQMVSAKCQTCSHRKKMSNTNTNILICMCLYI